MVPISEASLGYAQEVRRALRAARMHADVDTSDRKMQKKVREAQLEQYNYILARAPAAARPATPDGLRASPVRLLTWFASKSSLSKAACAPCPAGAARARLGAGAAAGGRRAGGRDRAGLTSACDNRVRQGRPGLGSEPGLEVLSPRSLSLLWPPRRQVVGEEEKKAGLVNVRTRDNHVHGMHALARVVETLRAEKAAKSIASCFGEGAPCPGPGRPGDPLPTLHAHLTETAERAVLAVCKIRDRARSLQRSASGGGQRCMGPRVSCRRASAQRGAGAAATSRPDTWQGHGCGGCCRDARSCGGARPGGGGLSGGGAGRERRCAGAWRASGPRACRPAGCRRRVERRQRRRQRCGGRAAAGGGGSGAKRLG